MLATPAFADEAQPEAPEQLLGEDGGRAYRRLLEWNAGVAFALVVVELRAPVRRDALVAWTVAHLPRACVVALLARACPHPNETAAPVLTRLEQAKERRRLCAQLNVQRDGRLRGHG